MKIKRIIAAVMAVCVIGGAGSPFIREKAGSNSFIAYAAEEEEYKYVEVDDIGYVVYSDHAEVNMFDVRTEGEVVIPEKVEGVPVTVVIRNSMSSPYNATSIKLPDTIETIGDCAFNRCDGLTSVNIPAKLKHIGARAFNGCSGIKEFKLPDLVSAETDPGQIIALDVDVPAEEPADVLQLVNGRREDAERDAREAIDRFHKGLSFLQSTRYITRPPRLSYPVSHSARRSSHS